jgi:hypothetical protein
MLFCQHPLCLSAESRWSLSERQEGQRLAARLCSHFSTRGPMSRGISLASVSASGGGRNSRGRGSTKSYQADARDIASAVARISAVQIIGRSNLVLWILHFGVAPRSGDAWPHDDSPGGRGSHQDALSPEPYILRERRPSGIAGWRKWFIARIWSEGTRDALLPASPVPERRVTVEIERTTGRPAISCTALFGFIFLELAT